jgi:lysozyme
MKGVRIAVAALSLSAVGYLSLVDRESYTDNAIIPTKGDVPTFGFGQTEKADGSPVKIGDKTTPVRALHDSISAIDTKYTAAVKRCVKVPLTQEELDLYVSLTYNIGTSGFCGSTIVRELNQQHYASACEHILDWRKYHGIDCSQPNKVCAGLWKDRLKLHAQCLAVQ